MIPMGAMIHMMGRTITCPIRHHHHQHPDQMTTTLLQDPATFHHPQDPTLATVVHDPRTHQLITPLRLVQDLLRNLMVIPLNDRIRMVPEGGRQMHMPRNAVDETKGFEPAICIPRPSSYGYRL